MRENAAAVFQSVYSTLPAVRAFAPGRVNLLGEHTDYNGGFVFPCALSLGIEGAARKRNGSRLRFFSADFAQSGVAECDLSAPCDGGWADYPKSVIKTFAAMGYPLPCGADFAFAGNLPDGAGLSSSAALEVLTGVLLREMFGFSVTAQELAVFGQFAENRFIGVNCGIMDQFASAMGQRGCAMLLGSATLGFSYAPLPQEAALVLVNSRVKHSLASSAYNDRRRECETALAQINTVLQTPSLCALSPSEFERVATAVKDPVCRRRAKHAVYENQRAIDGAKALHSGDLQAFGALMRQSHVSLQNDYAVSCAELDFLAQTAWGTEGVLGARMTGGGFGGCTVNLVRKEFAGSFAESIVKKYQKRFGVTASVYTVESGDGARVLPIE